MGGGILTDFIHGEVKSFQFGALGQEVGRHALHVVLAQVQRLDLWQTQRHTQLAHTVADGETQMENKCVVFFFCLNHSVITNRFKTSKDIREQIPTIPFPN